ncbi:MAG: glycosyltransferase, partial [Acidimicrobiales bacterium]
MRRPITSGSPAGATRETPASADIVEEAARRFGREYAAVPTTDVVLVIPAYNETGSVGDVVRSVPATLCGLTVTTLVVDDGSLDSTAAEAAEAGALVCRLAGNVGQGVAFRLGYRLARERGASYIATADADGQWDPRELPLLLELVLAGDADLANGSRRLG